MNLTDYVLLPREQRLAHINLTEPCVLHKRRNAWGGTKARLALLKLLGLENQKTTQLVSCCHLCPNDDPNGVCVNPRHCYLGTCRENEHDKPPEQRRNAIAKAKQTLGPERRSAAGRLANARLTPEERSARASRGNRTRREVR